MTSIDKERLFVFVGTEEDVQRYQKLLEHLIQQGNRVIVVTLEDAEYPTLISLMACMWEGQISIL